MHTSIFLLTLNLILLAIGASPVKGEAEAELVCDAPDTAHLCVVARDIETAVEQADVTSFRHDQRSAVPPKSIGTLPLPFQGDLAREAAAAALVTVAWHESDRFSPAMMDCSACPLGGPRCDRGKSISIYQLHTGVSWMGYSRDEICSDNLIATKISLHWLSYHGRRTRSVIGMMRGYAAGDPAIKSTAASEMERMFNLAMSRADLQLLPRLCMTAGR